MIHLKPSAPAQPPPLFTSHIGPEVRLKRDWRPPCVCEGQYPTPIGFQVALALSSGGLALDAAPFRDSCSRLPGSY